MLPVTQWWTITTRDLHAAPFSSDVAPFGYGDVWCARDLPAQGIVLSVTRAGLQVWRRDSGLCIAAVQPPGQVFALENRRLVEIGVDGSVAWVAEDRLMMLGPASARAEARVTGIPEDARSLCLSNDGVHAALHFPNSFAVYDLKQGQQLWSWEDEVDGLKFSPAGDLLLWEYTMEVQSGSDTLSYGALDTRTGENKGGRSNSCYDESTYWSADGKAILTGVWGKAPVWEYPLHRRRRRVKTVTIGLDPPPDPPPCYGGFLWVSKCLGFYEGEALAGPWAALDWRAAGQPHRHPAVLATFRLRDAASALSAELTGLEFEQERRELSKEQAARLAWIQEHMATMVGLVRQSLSRLTTEEPELLAAAQAFWAEDWARRAARDPEDEDAHRMALRWGRVVSGEIDDIIFERLLPH